MKAFYQNAELETVEFETEDVITTSAGGNTEATQGNLNDIFDTEIPDNTDPDWGGIV